jgi:hypothetical protein
VGSPSSPTLLRRRLARKLRQMREHAGLTLAEAGPRLDKKKSALSRVEKGQTAADVHLVRTMMDLYNHYEPGLVDLAREAALPGWWVAYGIRDRGFIGMETDAATSSELSLMYVPGLLQTEDYMRALFTSNRTRRTKKELENHVAARLFRQRRLTDAAFPLHLHAIIDENVLHRRMSGPEVREPQIRHLMEVAELDTVTLQVLPNELDWHSGMDGAFTMLEFAEDEDPDLLYVAHVAGALHTEKPEELTESKITFDDLRSTALSPDDSVTLIRRLAQRG